LVGLWLALGAPGHAAAQSKKQSVATLIKKGQHYFDEQQYEESVQTLSAALMRPGIAKKERIEVYRLLAYNYITLRRDEEADAAVRGLLALDPEFMLPATESPRFRDFFERTRQLWEKDGRPGFEATGQPTVGLQEEVTLKHTSPAQAEAGLDVRITGTVEDPAGEVGKIKLYYRTGSSGKFTTAPVKFAMYRFSAEIPAAAVEPPLVEYYLEAQDNTGLPVALRGDAAAPLRIAVPEGTGVFESPWFWVPVGLVVVGGIIVAAVVATSTDDDTAGTSTVTVNVFE